MPLLRKKQGTTAPANGLSGPVGLGGALAAEVAEGAKRRQQGFDHREARAQLEASVSDTRDEVEIVDGSSGSRVQDYRLGSGKPEVKLPHDYRRVGGAVAESEADRPASPEYMETATVAQQVAIEYFPVGDGEFSYAPVVDGGPSTSGAVYEEPVAVAVTEAAKAAQRAHCASLGYTGDIGSKVPLSGEAIFGTKDEP